LLASPEPKRASGWSADGKSVVYMKGKAGQWRGDLWQFPLNGNRTSIPLVQDRFNKMLATFSPDGRWLSYQSGESGRWEVYIQPLSSQGGKVLISADGGRDARWRADGKELFFVGADNRLMVVDMKQIGTRVEPGAPRALFSLPSTARHWTVGGGGAYEVTPDGQRFVVHVPVSVVPNPSITLILNWTAALKK
jgi:eukaryotic-like serine/threonine-protein kinase